MYNDLYDGGNGLSASTIGYIHIADLLQILREIV